MRMINMNRQLILSFPEKPKEGSKRRTFWFLYSPNTVLGGLAHYVLKYRPSHPVTYKVIGGVSFASGFVCGFANSSGMPIPGGLEDLISDRWQDSIPEGLKQQALEGLKYLSIVGPTVIGAGYTATISDTMTETWEYMMPDSVRKSRKERKKWFRESESIPGETREKYQTKFTTGLWAGIYAGVWTATGYGLGHLAGSFSK